MLEGVHVFVLILVVVGRIHEIIIFEREDVIERGTASWQAERGRIFHEDGAVAVGFEHTSVFVAQAGAGVAVAHHFGVAQGADRAMIRRHDDGDVFFRQSPEDLKQIRMLEPGFGESAEGGHIRRDLFQHVRIGARMHKRVHEVEHEGAEGDLRVILDAVEDAFPFVGGEHFLIFRNEPGFHAPAQGFQQLVFVPVQRGLVVVLKRPQVGVIAFDVAWVQTRENGVSRVRRGGRKDAAIEFGLDRVHIREHRFEDAPLVVAHAIDDEEQHRLPVFEMGLHEFLNHIRR